MKQALADRVPNLTFLIAVHLFPPQHSLKDVSFTTLWGSTFLLSFHCPLLSHETLWPFLGPSHIVSIIQLHCSKLTLWDLREIKRISKLPLGRELHFFPAKASSYPPESPLRDDHGGNTICPGQTSTSQSGVEGRAMGVGNPPGL